MGKKPRESELREEGALVLEEIKRRPPSVRVDLSQRDRLLERFGETEANIDQLLSLEENDDR